MLDLTASLCGNMRVSLTSLSSWRPHCTSGAETAESPWNLNFKCHLCRFRNYANSQVVEGPKLNLSRSQNESVLQELRGSIGEASPSLVRVGSWIRPQSVSFLFQFVKLTELSCVKQDASVDVKVLPLSTPGCAQCFCHALL